VLETGAQAAVDTASTQRITLTLQPALTGSDKTFISGTAEAHEE
jgi:hypothetical protein